MKECEFTYDFTETADELVTKLGNAVLEARGLFSGTTQSGDFSVPTYLGAVIGSYLIKKTQIKIEISRKPKLIKCEKIGEQITKVIVGNRNSLVFNFRQRDGGPSIDLNRIKSKSVEEFITTTTNDIILQENETIYFESAFRSNLQKVQIQTFEELLAIDLLPPTADKSLIRKAILENQKRHANESCKCTSGEYSNPFLAEVMSAYSKQGYNHNSKYLQLVESILKKISSRGIVELVSSNVNNIELGAGSELVFQNLQFLRANNIKLTANGTIYSRSLFITAKDFEVDSTRSGPSIVANGLDGDPGAAGLAGHPGPNGGRGRDANCSFPDDDCGTIGGDGGYGGDGTPGGSGGPAEVGGHIFMYFKRLYGPASFQARGGRGGHGGSGGSGGVGGSGGQGGNGLGCELGRRGGYGGTGGTGGIGGEGGEGGKGGEIVIRCEEDLTNGNRRFDVGAGAGGPGGIGGVGGPGGAPGGSGSTTGDPDPDNDCDTLDPPANVGSTGRAGQTGKSGMSGAPGKIEFIVED